MYLSQSQSLNKIHTANHSKHLVLIKQYTWTLIYPVNYYPVIHDTQEPPYLTHTVVNFFKQQIIIDKITSTVSNQSHSITVQYNVMMIKIKLL